MKPEIKEKWVKALRSGKYVQGYGRLRTENDQFCCLGVLCDLAAKEGVGKWDGHRGEPGFTDDNGDSSETKLPLFVKDWAGLDSSNPSVRLNGSTWSQSLATVNDTLTGSFEKIADLIETQL